MNRPCLRRRSNRRPAMPPTNSKADWRDGFCAHGGDKLDLTQEYIAEMLGVRRTSVSVVANTLQQAGMIDYARGHIRLKNVAALKETACECYETVKMNYSALLHSSNE